MSSSPLKYQQQFNNRVINVSGGSNSSAGNNDDIMYKYENEKFIVKQLFDQLLGIENNQHQTQNSSSNNSSNINNNNRNKSNIVMGSGQFNNSNNNNNSSIENYGNNKYIIKNFSKIYEIIELLKNDDISSFLKIKILDQLIQILSYSSNNTINLILNLNQTIPKIIKKKPKTSNNSNNNITNISGIRKSIGVNYLVDSNLCNNSDNENYEEEEKEDNDDDSNNEEFKEKYKGHKERRKSKTLYTNKSLVVLDELIQLLPTIDDENISLKTLQLIEILGTEHITVKQVRRIFRLFDKNYLLTHYKPNHYFLQNGLPNLFKSLDVMTFRKTPSSVFYLNGINSGLIVDPIGKVPSSGYTISTWINIESFQHDNSESIKVYEPRLFSFLNEGGAGLESFFENGKLIFRVNSKVKTVICDQEFPTNKWNHLIITHVPTKKWGIVPGASPLTVYLNGKMIFSQNVKYPSTSKNLNVCSIGTVPSSNLISPTSSNGFTHIASNQSECCLKCQLGSFSMLSTSFSDSDAQDLIKKGSNYIFKKQKFVIFTFSPKSFYGGVCHGLGNRELDNSINAFSIGDLKIFSTFSIKDSVYLIGGPQIIFPLLQSIEDQFKFKAASNQTISASSPSLSSTQYHVPSPPTNSSSSSIISNSSSSSSSSNNYNTNLIQTATFKGSQEDINQLSKLINYPRVSSILRFITHLLINDKYNQNEVLKSSGISMLGHLMSRLFSNSEDPNHPYNTNTLEREEFDLIFDSLDQLTDICFDKNPIALLKLNIYREIIFNFNIWINIKKEYQIQLFNLIIFKVSQDPQYFRENIKVRYLLDCIKYYYHINEKQLKQQELNKKKNNNNSNSNNNGNNNDEPIVLNYLHNHLTSDGLKEIISYIFDIIKIIIKPVLNEKEVPEIQEIIRFILDSECNSIVIKESLMIILYNLFLPVSNQTNQQQQQQQQGANSQQTPSPVYDDRFLNYDTIRGFLNSFEAFGDIRSLLGLLKHDNEQVQVLVIKIIGKYMNIAECIANGSSGNVKRHSTLLKKSSFDDYLYFIGDQLIEFEMTDLIYRGLSEIVTDNITPSIADTPNSPLLELVGNETLGPSNNSSSNKDSNQKNKLQRKINVTALEVICKLAFKAPYVLQQKILNEILLCIKHLPQLRAGILDRENWQNWLLSLWPTPRSNTSSPPWSPPISPTLNSSNSKAFSPPSNSEDLEQRHQSLSESRRIYNEQVSNRTCQSGIKEILTGIMKVLLFDCINKKEGWKFIEETEAWISSLLPNGVPLERRIFYECLLNLERGLKSSTDTNTSSILLKNYVNLVSIIEDFVFSHTMNILSHRNTQSQWEDFGVVAKLLDIFDISQSIQTVRIQSNVVKQMNPFQSTGVVSSGQSPTGSMSLSPYIMTLAHNSGTIDLPSIDVTSGSAKAKSSIHTIYRLCLCIFQEAESCFYGERESYNLSQRDPHSENADDDERNFAIRVWGLPMICEDMDQIISKNSIRIQTILASERDQKEQVKHVMWIVCSLITIIRRHRENHTDKIIMNTQSIIISLLKSLLKTYGDLIDNFICPPNILAPIADSINKTITGNSSSTNNLNSTFAVHTILSLNEPQNESHPEFMKYFKDKLLQKITLLDKLHEIKDHYETAHLSSAFTMTRRNKVSETIKGNNNKQQSVIAYRAQKLLAKSISASQKYEFQEIQHKNDFEEYVLQYRIYLDRLWDKQFKDLTKEPSPWHEMEPRHFEKTIWKLYNFSNSNRIHILLKQDYDGTNHPGAALSNQQQYNVHNSSPIIKQTQDEQLKNNPVLRKVINLNNSSSGLSAIGNVGSQMEQSIESTDLTQGLVGFEMDDTNIVLDEAHETDWYLVDEQTSNRNIIKSKPTNSPTVSNHLVNNSADNSPNSTTNPTSIATNLSTGSLTPTEGFKNISLISSSSNSSTILTNQLTQLNPKRTNSSNSNKKSILEFSAQGEIIKPMMVIRVKMSIYTDKIVFSPTQSQEDNCIPDKYFKEKEYDIKKLIGVQNRRYLLLPTALEFFFIDRKSVLVNFPHGSIVLKIMKLLGSLSGTNEIIFKINNFDSNLSPQQLVIKYLNPTARWKKREISNFEYLMTLNTIAGRTYNDLNQYPVFPWIISDYNSSKLDLNDPKVYRDLSKPIGALNPTRLEHFMERWTQCPDEIPRFMYGTHYSSSGSVLFFLMRSEPFTSHFIKLQSGQFDHADRMFDSIIDCWRNCLNSSSDVKELTPEFFYLPEFLINRNGVEFGVKQNGKAMNDVVLPPWAPTPHHFIMINRMALESEYVSRNLHHWVDLIFGFKQKGKEAIQAHNVFYHLTYEGSVDIGAMSDPILREATRVQINNFGVTPSQLFTTPHPSRDPPNQKFNSKLEIFKKLKPLQLISLPFSPLCIFVYGPSSNRDSMTVGSSLISGVVGGGSNQLGDRILVIGEANNDFQYYRYLESNISAAAGFMTQSITPLSQNIPLSLSLGLRSVIGKPFCQIPGNSKLLLSSGKCDNTLHVIHGDSKLTTGPISHKSAITCIAYDEHQCGRLGVGGIIVEQRVIVTGSDDSTAIIWELDSSDYSVKPVHILRGHNFGITCISINKSNDICLTAGKDGKVLVHSIKKGTFFKSIEHPNKLPIHSMIFCAESSSIFIYSNTIISSNSTFSSSTRSPLANSDSTEWNNVLYRFSINGDLIQSVLNDVQPTIVKMLITKSQNGIRYLLSAGGYQIVVREMLNLEIVHVFDIRDLSGFTSSNRIVDLYLWGSDESYQKPSTNSNSNDNSQQNISNLVLMVPLESCQLLIYSLDESGNLKSLSD
ncbi:hypothetical protein DICPUDRAFT_155301 [Dictyostelium purpureum]|uniref:BEACH domain-containing protein n=1 Tax=Dictyostelium purpureum TaxID=5786 RepID=F0ZTM1_DICPU|nr:uncharacterized protein DICPUDRAFT_155301 [Dictyostelium purpureum]EGC32702.1 hypothetical protein DICPUDRAFT_155301 [Dictyostelium purpureum]|eukprot:XP_003290771.1 hypothetical protein DICPUDRAFT_155301 [Dictyostelium purpureum]